MANPTPHGAGVRGFNLAPSSRFFNGRFGRLFRALPPAEFGEMLYTAIEQDAWLLYVHGGLLGVLVGAVHLLLFGW